MEQAKSATNAKLWHMPTGPPNADSQKVNIKKYYYFTNLDLVTFSSF